MVSSWRIDDYQVVRIAGSLTRRIRRLSDERMNMLKDKLKFKLQKTAIILICIALLAFLMSVSLKKPLGLSLPSTGTTSW